MQHLDIRPSKKLLGFLVVLVASTITIICNLTWFVSFKLLLSIAIAIYGYYLINRWALLRHPFSIISITQQSDGKFKLNTPSGHYQATLEGDSTITAHLMILRFQVAYKLYPITALIFPESIGKSNYHHLKVSLRNSSAHSAQ